MNVKVQKIVRWTKKHLPDFLTVFGAAGVIGTAYLAAKASPLATEEKFIDRAKHYIPAAGVGLVTIGCIGGSLHLSKRQNAALVGACTIAAKNLDEYKGAVKELFGEEASAQVVEKISAEKAKDVDIWTTDLCGTSSLDFGDELEETHMFCDTFSGRYFESTISRVLQAQYYLNRNFMLGGAVSVNDFYEFLGISKIENGDVIGWPVRRSPSCCDACSGLEWIDFDNYRCTMEDGEVCYVIDMVFQPEPLDEM